MNCARFLNTTVMLWMLRAVAAVTIHSAKSGCYPITIPKHEPIKKVYVQKVKEIVEAEIDDKK